eukprot:COSAG06_NODE_24332_length_666_cov_0.708995_1_plen_45_part_01
MWHTTMRREALSVLWLDRGRELPDERSGVLGDLRKQIGVGLAELL